MADETVGQLAELYLGNILYAIELAAVSLDAQGRGEDAAFYRAIARKLAESHGKGRDARRPPQDAASSAEDVLPGGTY
jgi:hypothetical protein